MTDPFDDMPDGERELFEQMQRDYDDRGELSPETQAWINLRTPNFLVAARAQAEQELMNAWLAKPREEGSVGPSDLDIMELAWSRLSVDQQHQALHHDLFGVYAHYTRQLKEERDRIDMDRLTGASYLDNDDLDVLLWAHVGGLGEGETMKDMLGKEPTEDMSKGAWVTVPYDTMWRVLKEVELLRAREDARKAKS